MSLRPAWCFWTFFEVLQQNIKSGNLNLPHKKREEEGGRQTERGFNLPPESRVRILTRNILTLCVGSIKDALIIKPPPICSCFRRLVFALIPLSVYPPFLSSSSFLSVFLSTALSRLLGQMSFSLVLDETESVGLIIPDQGFELSAASRSVECCAGGVAHLFLVLYAMLNKILPPCVWCINE